MIYSRLAADLLTSKQGSNSLCPERRGDADTDTSTSMEKRGMLTSTIRYYQSLWIRILRARGHGQFNREDRNEAT